MLPRLMYERLEDLGMNFVVVYPTAGPGYHRMQDTRLRRAICRAYNVFTADQFRGLEDRIIPAAIIPMYTRRRRSRSWSSQRRSSATGS